MTAAELNAAIVKQRALIDRLEHNDTPGLSGRINREWDHLRDLQRQECDIRRGTS
jgi:hypothetical protein